MNDAVTLEIEIAAPPERVFRALTDPAQLVAWFGGDADYSGKLWEIDLRVGGKWRNLGHDRTCGDYEMSGEILEIDPPRLLCYTWRYDGHPGPDHTVVRYELDRAGQGTRLRMTHSGFAGFPETAEEYRKGWPAVLAALRDHMGIPVST